MTDENNDIEQLEDGTDNRTIEVRILTASKQETADGKTALFDSAIDESKFSNKIFLRSNSGTIEAKNSTSPYFPLSRGSFTAKYTILTDFAAGEVLDLATGSGSISGTCTVTGQPANLSLPANATL